MFRAGLIGCGRIGSEVADDPRVGGIYSHAEAYVCSRGTTLAGVCDADSTKATRCADRWSLPSDRAFTDPAAFLEVVMPEIVSICTPDASHEEVLRLVLDAPGIRAVVVEKPIAMTVAAAAPLVELAAARGIVLAVNYHRRYASSFQRVRHLIRAGTLGELQVISCLYTGGLLHNGSHVLDALRYLAGELVSVQGWDVLAEAGADPTLDARATFAGGARATLSGGRADGATVFELDLLLTHGRIRLADHGNTVTSYAEGDLPFYSGYRGLVPDGMPWPLLGDVLLHLVDDVIDVVERGGAPRCTGEDGVAALRAAEAIRDSARAGSVVVEVR